MKLLGATGLASALRSGHSLRELSRHDWGLRRLDDSSQSAPHGHILWYAARNGTGKASGTQIWSSARASSVAPGAVPGGQVIGQTDAHAERPLTRAVSAQNVLGTVYHALGIDYKQKLNDFAGRPMQLSDDGEPIAELV